MDSARLFKRIGHRRLRQPTIVNLRALHRCFMRSVPFENLDIHLGREIVLDIEAVYHKVVDQGRGGFCYELNGLFYFLLKEIGYNVRMVAAEVLFGSLRNEFDHMALLIDDAKKMWLVDVGFGDSSLAPLDLTSLEVQSDGRKSYRVTNVNRTYTMLRKDSQEWVPCYSFSLKSRSWLDFAKRCRWQQTSLDSHFTKVRLCTLPQNFGRVSLSDNILTYSGRRAKRWATVGEQEYLDVLRREFGINLGTSVNWKNLGSG